MTPIQAPLVRGAGTPPPALKSEPYVLVVDDEAVVREFLGRCIHTAGFAVQYASGAAEALEMMVATPAAAVLCDIRMPGQDGLWLVERLHAHWPTVPVVMTSAIDDPHTMARARALGAVEYVTKPVQAAQLMEILNRIMASGGGNTATKDDSEATIREASDQEEHRIEAEYALETPLRCPACGERICALKCVRLARSHVNFTSTLPRRGRVLACPHCLAIVPAELSNF
jgi:CheY-like chemotaxis protein